MTRAFNKTAFNKTIPRMWRLWNQQRCFVIFGVTLYVIIGLAFLFHTENKYPTHINTVIPSYDSSTGGISFPKQISNFAATASQEEELINTAPDPATSRFIRYQNSRMRCDAFVGDRVGVFQGPPYPPTEVRGPGLLHQMTNLKTLLTEAHALGRVAIIEHVPFDGDHNRGRFVCAPWSRYLDMVHVSKEVPIWPGWIKLSMKFKTRDKDPVEYFSEYDTFETLNASKAKVVVRDFGPTMAEYMALSRGSGYWKHQQEVLELLVESKFVASIAYEAVEKMLKDGARSFVCVKVRRGDKLAEVDKYPCLDECTQGERVVSKLRKNKVSMKKDVVFLMTNEADKSFFKDVMRSGYRVETSESLGLLENSEVQVDNFLLFAVEIAVCRNARGMIGTIHEKFEHLGAGLQQFEFVDRLTPYRKTCRKSHREARIYKNECENACKICKKNT